LEDFLRISLKTIEMVAGISTHHLIPKLKLAENERGSAYR
jgi:hypothetical protein